MGCSLLRVLRYEIYFDYQPILPLIFAHSISTDTAKTYNRKGQRFVSLNIFYEYCTVK